MKVKGNIQSVQSDLDFCIRITSTNNIRTVDKLRKHFFSIFMAEERERLLELVEEKRKKAQLVEHEVVVEPEVIEKPEEIVSTTPVQENPFLKGFFNRVTPKVVETNSENTFVHQGIFLDEEDDLTELNGNSTTIEFEDEYEDVEEKEDVYVAPKQPNNFLTRFNVEPEKDIVDPLVGVSGYVSNGILLDELEDSKEVENNSVTYSLNGIFLDEIEEFIPPLFDINTSMVEKEDIIEEPETSEETDTFIDLNAESEYDSFMTSVKERSSNKSTISRDEKLTAREKRREELRVRQQQREEELLKERTYSQEVKVNEPEIDSEVEFGDDLVSYSEDLETGITFEVTKDEEPTDAPKDIRDFLRQHPNASISFVSKFSPSKEIEKQIKLGRIYKKKGKLMI